MFDTSAYHTSQARKIRKNWLISAWVTYLVDLISSTFWTGFFVCAVGTPSVVIFYLFVHATGLIQFWITYHCAYKNDGTAWLLFLMIIPFFFVCNFAIEDIYTLLNEYKSNGSLYGLISVLIRTTLTLYYLINCYRLYQLNKLKKRKRQDAKCLTKNSLSILLLCIVLPTKTVILDLTALLNVLLLHFTCGHVGFVASAGGVMIQLKK